MAKNINPFELYQLHKYLSKCMRVNGHIFIRAILGCFSFIEIGKIYTNKNMRNITTKNPNFHFSLSAMMLLNSRWLSEIQHSIYASITPPQNGMREFVSFCYQYWFGLMMFRFYDVSIDVFSWNYFIWIEIVFYLMMHFACTVRSVNWNGIYME